MDPQEFADILAKSRASAILRTPHGNRAQEAMRSAIRGGFQVCEFTLTIPDALDHIRAICEEFPQVVVGAGTVLTADDAEKAVAAGARFLVSPVVDPEVIEIARELNVASIPGCATPTEMLAAHRAGATLVKLFPGPAGGPAWVKAVLGPLPFLKIVPTSGVDLHNAADFLAAGAHAIGFVAPLFVPEDVEARRWDRIEQRAQQLVAACQLNAVERS
ncbi:MAG: bifunctional 4-hydroxy-2-oxoglutarate aldolase/2-dehydro-3-deoxy-phosphogluconate aldolase [Planctomycetota bacterium]|nr:bifunctional 4-hydroxy-2-oxoglutarate aldolase/2-dehydro-3-deoxy-phosphogluconate aldolase [Planctomycetota bacterium]